MYGMTKVQNYILLLTSASFFQNNSGLKTVGFAKLYLIKTIKI